MDAVKSSIRHKMGENSYFTKLTGEREGKVEWNTTIEPQAKHTHIIKVYYISFFYLENFLKFYCICIAKG